jgi:uncharacterized protein
MDLEPTDPLAVAAVRAIQRGEVGELERLLTDHPGLARARLIDVCGAITRTLLHVATDWPGHFPNGPATVGVLVRAAADVNARCTGKHQETPLHWAASSNDVAVLDALLDSGADIDAPGAVIGGGSPLADARGFGQWRAAYRLVERGARTTLVDEATLGLMDRLTARFGDDASPSPTDISAAFWGACHGGQQASAAFLLARGAELNRVSHGGMTPLDVAREDSAEQLVGKQRAAELVEWLVERGARTAHESA